MLHLSLEKSDVKFRYLEKLYHFLTKFVNIFRYFFLYLQILWSFDSFSMLLIYLTLLVTCFSIFLTIFVCYWPFGQYWLFWDLSFFSAGRIFTFFGRMTQVGAFLKSKYCFRLSSHHAALISRKIRRQI
jgi:hypothetical protein